MSEWGVTRYILLQIKFIINFCILKNCITYLFAKELLIVLYFLTQGLNPGLLHCRQTLYHLSHQGSPLYKTK